MGVVLVVKNVAKHVIRDKFAAEVETASAKLHKLKAEPKTAKADFEIKVIKELISKQRKVLHKLRQAGK